MNMHTFVLHSDVSVGSHSELDSSCPQLNHFDHIEVGANLVWQCIFELQCRLVASYHFILIKLDPVFCFESCILEGMNDKYVCVFVCVCLHAHVSVEMNKYSCEHKTQRNSSRGDEAREMHKPELFSFTWIKNPSEPCHAMF